MKRSELKQIIREVIEEDRDVYDAITEVAGKTINTYSTPEPGDTVEITKNTVITKKGKADPLEVEAGDTFTVERYLQSNGLVVTTDGYWILPEYYDFPDKEVIGSTTYNWAGERV
jgi:hypothetical protein